MLDWLLRGGNAAFLLAAFTVLWRVNLKLSRDESLKSDFPPHRHINGKILYPREYEPAKVERMAQ
jgi:hypothetical protein